MDNIKLNRNLRTFIFLLLTSLFSYAQVTLEQEVKITDLGLHFNGATRGNDRGVPDNGDPDSYDFVFGRNISAHGDAVKAFGNYVFMTWYRGGKLDRHMMLSRYNTVTKTVVTVEFPHRHTGFQNRWWLGESHNTIAVGISPLDGTIHLLYDMHAYSPTKPSDGSLANDYFRYSYSIENAAYLPDDEFTLDKFVQSSSGDYKHLRTPGNIDQREFLALTYPRFFLNDEGDLLFFMREGGNNNGMYKFTKYNANTGNWEDFVDFNRLNANREPGIQHNWGLYGDIKYVNGKIRIGFQRRLANNNDKYMFQNGVYYAYSDDPSGATQWKDHKGEPFSVPLFDADKIKIMEPGDYVETTNVGRVRIVGGFDWTVTANGDVHIKSEVRDLDNNVTKNLHTYKPAGAEEFITTEQSIKGAFYTSGPNVYTVGLENGRPIVFKAEGGTDNFEKVYEATTGRRFDHGVVHIENGKAYFYLMEDGSGSAQPLYLQIIDLDVAPVDPTLANNFTIKATGETCPNMDNGTITINAGAVSNYTAKLNGVDYSFNKRTVIENLAPGSYDLCVDIEEENLTRCFTVNIDESEILAAKIQISKKSADISVSSGTAPFTVLKNGEEVLKTNQSNFSLNVNDGDAIQIKSSEACQGEMEKTVSLLDDFKAYPNPSNGIFNLFLSENIKSVNIELYDVRSRLLSAKDYNVNSGTLKLNLQDKPNGIYFIKVNLSQPKFVKVIKQ